MYAHWRLGHWLYERVIKREKHFRGEEKFFTPASQNLICIALIMSSPPTTNNVPTPYTQLHPGEVSQQDSHKRIHTKRQSLTEGIENFGFRYDNGEPFVLDPDYLEKFRKRK